MLNHCLWEIIAVLFFATNPDALSFVWSHTILAYSLNAFSLSTCTVTKLFNWNYDIVSKRLLTIEELFLTEDERFLFRQVWYSRPDVFARIILADRLPGRIYQEWFPRPQKNVSDEETELITICETLLVDNCRGQHHDSLWKTWQNDWGSNIRPHKLLQ